MLKGSTLYNITDNATAGSKASMAVVEFQGQGYLPKDLALFEASEGLPPQACRNITGPADTTKTAGVEASLDIQYVIAAGTGVPADFWLDSSGSFDLMGWATYVEGLSNPALVWSMSYGEGVNGGNGGTLLVYSMTLVPSMCGIFLCVFAPLDAQCFSYGVFLI